MQNMVADLGKIISFALDEKNFHSFDDLLEVAKIDDIQNSISQAKHLLNIERLKEKLIKLKEKLNFVL
jgi:hypothetical protein